MSTLTKVFTLLVAALSIFLCGVVVTFVSNTYDYKTAYEERDTIAQAAQVQALAAEMILTERLQSQKAVVQITEAKISEVQEIINELTRQLKAEQKVSADKDSQSQTAIQTMEALRTTIQNMYTAQLALQQALDDNRAEKIKAQTKQIELTRQLNRLMADNKQLENVRKRQVEKIYELEEDIKGMQQKLGIAGLTTTEFEPSDRVTLVTPGQADVPIQGQITLVEGDKVALSVGSSSGVREGMKFFVTRGNKFLGNVQIIYVESGESVGQLDNQQGAVVKGDSVTTGFY